MSDDKKYNAEKYDDYRNQISTFRKKGNSWEKIKYALKNNEEGLERYINYNVDENAWERIDVDDWYQLVKIREEIEQKSEEVREKIESASISGVDDIGDIKVPTGKNSYWQLYKNKLKEKGFSDKAIMNIEQSSLWILRRLSIDTSDTDSRKGMVFGNVQSGKTANMAGLISMAADYGWNFFIILSGTIENLRVQTQKRLINDLTCDFYWLNHLKKKSDHVEKLQNMDMTDEKNKKYITVCLKNKARLKDMLGWMLRDPNKRKQMKILVIEDEADLAGVNTTDVNNDKKERKAINKYITSIVNSKDEKGKNIEKNYKAMNYVGYTATPYANVLNESGRETLYPKDFIVSLPISDEYFGPQQIFGCELKQTDGIDIVRKIEEKELNLVKEIELKKNFIIPKNMEKSLCWLICSAAAERFWGIKKPVSMLIHTSQKQDHHDGIKEAIEYWFKSKSLNDKLKICKKVWDEETSRFTIDSFKEQYPDYALIDKIKDYPVFDEIKEEIVSILSNDLTYIKLDDESELKYSDGIHLCVDNCRNNGISDDGVHLRLAYPNKNNMPDKAPIFVIIGGATLSRGLTIEGLVSTYFLRSSRQADSLMQMGRWFGYRKGYEMLPRIWMTSDMIDKFQFLSELDEELRIEIKEMVKDLKKPSEYAPMIKNSPINRFRITSANKMQSAIAATVDYSGTLKQTTRFLTDSDVQKYNISLTESFIKSLGEYKFNNDGAIVWKGIENKDIFNYLKEMKFSNRMEFFGDIETLEKWEKGAYKEKKLDKWNVIVSGTKISNSEVSKWEISKGVYVGEISRTALKNSYTSDSFSIGTLMNPKDIIADTNMSEEELIEKYSNSDNGGVTKYRYLRSKRGYDNIPQIIIYRIDKNSDISEHCKSSARKPLDSEHDLIGVTVHIPGNRYNKSYVRKIMVKLKNYEF